MKNYICAGNVFPFTATSDVKSGQFVRVGDVVGVSQGDVPDGQTGLLQRTGVYDGPKKTGEAWSVGQKLYWDNDAQSLSETGTGLKRVGVVYQAAASDAEIGRVLLDGAVT